MSKKRKNRFRLFDAQSKKVKDFYRSWEWKRLRYDFLKQNKRRCGCCGSSPADGARIVVDHIKPIRRFWNLRLDKSNLQILCDDCNMGKGSRDQTDWRVGDNTDWTQIEAYEEAMARDK